MKMIITMLSVLFLSISCVDLNGSLQTNEALKVKIKSGFLNLKTKTITIAPGTTPAQLIIKSSKNITLQLKGGSLGNVKIPLKSDDSLNIPANGQIYIEGKKIDQPFNASGSITTNYNNYGYTDAIEACDRQIVESRCEKICTKEGRCDSVCKDVTTTIYGQKEVSYHYLSTDRQVSLEIMPENSTAVAGVLTARGIDTDKIVDRESLCR
ncbi:MAG: hypothetical protein H7336_05170 [Bacteriovorax sp.]|nr:hypothetical protein [Bacteriovorax sp.]